MESRPTNDELMGMYRVSKSLFLQLHRIMIRLGLVGDKERIQIYDLTKRQ